MVNNEWFCLLKCSASPYLSVVVYELTEMFTQGFARQSVSLLFVSLYLR